MSDFDFRGLDGAQVTPSEWLKLWADKYRVNDYQEHDVLMKKYEHFSAEDFAGIGKWKDGAKTPDRWKANVASVAYPIWMQAATELPKCPEQSGVANFLKDWASRTYTDEYGTKDEYATKHVGKSFGLSRATTLLYFLSGGRFPIFDSRVRTALERLLDAPVSNTVGWYLDSYCPLFSKIAAVCGATDLRKVDMALFSYGAKKSPFRAAP